MRGYIWDERMVEQKKMGRRMEERKRDGERKRRGGEYSIRYNNSNVYNNIRYNNSNV
jgi:hypothetical protein